MPETDALRVPESDVLKMKLYLTTGKSEGIMEKKHIDSLIKIIAHKKNAIRPYFKLNDIKELAKKIQEDGYSISNKTNKDQIDDPFLNSFYFDFIAEVWDSKVSGKMGEGPEVALELANDLTKAGYAVTKDKG